MQSSQNAITSKSEIFKKNLYILSSTEGCATNLQENNSYRKEYESKGFLVVDSPLKADVILINTCAYSQQMEDRSSQMIRDFQLKYPQAEIKIAGCLPKINPKMIKTEFNNISTVSLPENILDFQSSQFDRQDFEFLSDKHKFILTLRPIYYYFEKLLGFKFHPLHNIFKTVIVNEDFYLITASTGCLGKCTFCAIKRAKGSLKSRPLETILSELRAGLKLNRELFWLLGDDIGCWGLDINQNISILLKEMTQIQDNFKLVLNYFDPHYLQNDTQLLISLLSNSKIIGLNMPIQSGSQKILALMKRNYDLTLVFDTLKKIKKTNPQVAIKTNIIVGFPGETWSDFFKSVVSIKHFDAILALEFTARPNTPAASYENQNSRFVKKIKMFLMNIVILFRHAQVSIYSFVSPTKG